jgi:hypothetical protein
LLDLLLGFRGVGIGCGWLRLAFHGGRWDRNWNFLRDFLRRFRGPRFFKAGGEDAGNAAVELEFAQDRLLLLGWRRGGAVLALLDELAQAVEVEFATCSCGGHDGSVGKDRAFRSSGRFHHARRNSFGGQLKLDGLLRVMGNGERGEGEKNEAGWHGAKMTRWIEPLLVDTMEDKPR